MQALRASDRGDRALIDWHSARALAHGCAAALPAHHAALNEVSGRVLAENLVARVPLPAFDTAAMDGFAVAGRGPWIIRGEIRAGHTAERSLWVSEAVAISTGAPVPDGATCVLPVEDAVVDDARLRAGTGWTLVEGKHIRRVGEDTRAGALLAPAGTRIRAALIGMAAMAGYDDLLVRHRPRVALLVTGDEITAHGRSDNGKVRDALGPMLPPLVAAMGGEVIRLVRVPDGPGHLDHAVQEAGPVEIVLVTGSTSVGVSDRLRGLLADIGARLVVDSVACRPGRPQLLAELAANRWLIGLPGNPFAAFVAAQTLLAPLIAALTGRPPVPLSDAPVRGEILTSANRTVLVPVLQAADGFHVVPGHRSGDLRGAASADALAVVDDDDRPPRILPFP